MLSNVGIFILQLTDGFDSIFYHRNWRAKVSCDVDINQSTGSMVM